MASRIFISYRRDDSDIWVGRLADELRRHFPPEQIFQDVASIDPGAPFKEVLNRALESAAAMLVVIGPRWLTATDKQGRKRLEQSADLVRQEVAESLRRPGVRVFPLLVGGAEMPAEEELPEPLQPLAERHAIELTVRHWSNDVAQLVQTLKRVPGLADDGKPDEDIARQRAAEEKSRRELEERAAKEVAKRRAAEEQAKKSADAEARRKAKPEAEARRRSEEDARRKAAEEESRPGAATVREPPPRVPWKPLAAIGAVLATALIVFFAPSKTHTPESATAPTAASTPPPTVAVPQEQAPAAESRPVPARPVKSTSPPPTRNIVINGPRPLYAPLKTGDVFQECAECPEMVVIVPNPDGFTIGTPDSQAQWGRDDDEKPFGPIRFAKPYAIGKLEITRAQFRASGVQAGVGCYAWTGKEWKLDQLRSSEQPGFEQGADHPVVCISWNEAQSYLSWLNRQAGIVGKGAYRLPSEAEWEYAARAGTTTVRYWGNDPGQACGYANVADQTLKQTFADWTIHECRDGYVHTAPVGRFKANAFGLRDMIGNVGEWVQDCYEKQYAESIRDGSAFETQNCGVRMLRGGSWSNRPVNARAANRFRSDPGLRLSRIGFRVARTL